MKKIFFIILLLLPSILLKAQTYNPNLQPPITKPLGAYGMNSVDARSFYYDPQSFTYRPYLNTNEVNGYLDMPLYRQGNFPIFVYNNAGDSIYVWWYQNGTADSNLVPYDPAGWLHYTKEQANSLFFSNAIFNTANGNLTIYTPHKDSLAVNLDDRYLPITDTTHRWQPIGDYKMNYDSAALTGYVTHSALNEALNNLPAGSGTVSSVGLSLPDIFSVTGSPVTSSGTLTGSLVSQSPNLIFASPNGVNGSPSFRSLANSDFPVSGVTAGTYNNLTVNAKGIVTGASNASYITNETDALALSKTISFNGTAKALSTNPAFTQANADWNATSGPAQILNRLPLDNVLWVTSVPTTWQKNTLYFVNPTTASQPTTNVYIDGVLVQSVDYLTKIARLGVLRWVGGNGGYYYFDDWNIHDDVNNIDVFTDDFENGTLSNWLINSGTPTNSTDKAHSGTHSFKTSSGLTNVTKTNFSINTSCTITVWMYDDTSLKSQQVGALIDDGSQILCIGVDGVATSEQYYWVRTKDNQTIATSVPRSTGWHKIQVVFSLTIPKKQTIVTDGAGTPFNISVQNVGLNDILTNGNVSTLGLTAGQIKGTRFTISDIAMHSLKQVGTDADGNFIKYVPSVIEKNIDDTLTSENDIVLGNTTDSTLNFTLPNPGDPSMHFIIKNTGTISGNLLIIKTSEAINSTGTTSVSLDTGQVARLRYFNGVWYEL